MNTLETKYKPVPRSINLYDGCSDTFITRFDIPKLI